MPSWWALRDDLIHSRIELCSCNKINLLLMEPVAVNWGRPLFDSFLNG